MYVTEVTYKDFEGDEVTEKLYFNLSRADFIRLNAEYDEGFEKYVRGVIKNGSNKDIFAMFEKLISMTYGIKDPDTHKFRKNRGALEEFMASEAYGEFLVKLFNDTNMMVEFFNKILPAEVQGSISKEQMLAEIPEEYKNAIAESK